MRDGRTGRTQADLVHGLFELLAVFRLIDGFTGRTDQFDAELFQYTVGRQIQRTVQCGLATHRRQQRIGALGLDDAGNHLPGDRLDVGHISHLRVSHDGGRIRIHQNNFVTFFTQRLAGLCARIVEFTGLADNDRAGANDENAF